MTDDGRLQTLVEETVGPLLAAAGVPGAAIAIRLDGNPYAASVGFADRERAGRARCVGAAGQRRASLPARGDRESLAAHGDQVAAAGDVRLRLVRLEGGYDRGGSK